MMTVVTTTRLRPGGEEEWDAAMRERFDSARGRPGWISGQLLTPVDEPGRPHHRRDVAQPAGLGGLARRSRVPGAADATLERLEAEPNRTQWFDVVADARADA